MSKPSFFLVAHHSLDSAKLDAIAFKLATICGSPPFKIESECGLTGVPVYTFTSTRKKLSLKNFLACRALIDGIQYGLNHL